MLTMVRNTINNPCRLVEGLDLLLVRQEDHPLPGLAKGQPPGPARGPPPGPAGEPPPGPGRGPTGARGPWSAWA